MRDQWKGFRSLSEVILLIPFSGLSRLVPKRQLRRIHIKALQCFKAAFHREEESQRKVLEGVEGKVYVYKYDPASGFCYLRVPTRCEFWTAFINLQILRKVINAEPDQTILVI